MSANSNSRRVDWIGSGTLKRILDFACVCVALAFIFPVMAIIALLIKITSHGPYFLSARAGGLEGEGVSAFQV